MSTATVKTITGNTEIKMEFDRVETLGAAEKKAKAIMRDAFQIQRVHIKEIQLSNGKSRRYEKSD